jgi:hypothetical protein
VDPESRGLAWHQPSFHERAYELREGTAVVADLRFDPRPAITWAYTDPLAARAAAGDQRWQLAVSRPGPGGFLGFSGTVRVAGRHTASVELRSFLTRGAVAIPGRPAIEWHGGLWRGSTSIFTEGATRLVALSSGSPLERVVTRVEVTARARQYPEWPLLAALGLYLRMLSGRVWR